MRLIERHKSSRRLHVCWKFQVGPNIAFFFHGTGFMKFLHRHIDRLLTNILQLSWKFITGQNEREESTENTKTLPTVLRMQARATT
jgi:hypothetical protein